MSEEAKGRKAFEGDTVLYHPAMGAKLFTADDAHPGDEWSDAPAVTGVQAAGGQALGSDGVGTADHIATAVEQALKDQASRFDAKWAQLTADHRRLDDENSDLRRDISSRDEEIRQLNAKVAEQAEIIAKFDGDGDGKPGGSAPKATPKK